MQSSISKYTKILLRHGDPEHPECKRFLETHKDSISLDEVRRLGELILNTELMMTEDDDSEDVHRDTLDELRTIVNDNSLRLPIGAFNELLDDTEDRITELENSLKSHTNKPALKPYAFPGSDGWDNHNKQTEAFERIINLLKRLKEREVIGSDEQDCEVDWAIGKIKGLIDEAWKDRIDISEAKKAIEDALKNGEESIPWGEAVTDLGCVGDCQCKSYDGASPMGPADKRISDLIGRIKARIHQLSNRRWPWTKKYNIKEFLWYCSEVLTDINKDVKRLQ